MMTPRLLLGLSLLLVHPACTDADIGVDTADGSLIYGVDDRRDYYQLTSSSQLALASSTAALVDSSMLSASGGGYALNTSISFGAEYGLCTDEPYRTQPSSAFCSGFVIGPDLIATAGHCINTAAECAATSIVFGFRMDDASTVRRQLPANDVYRCTQIVARQATTVSDFAVIRVERAIVGHPALAVRRTGKVADGAQLVLAGYPAGIPLKVAGGATVRSNSPIDYFEANVDSYGGNSGSPVVDAGSGLVEGILVRGNVDFVWSKSYRCYRSNVCNDGGCPGWEDATRATKLAPWLGCESDAACSDGNPCNGDETCGPSGCVAGVPIDCDDGNFCTADACVGEGGGPACASTTIACNDGNACTTDVCTPTTGCAFTPVQCPAGQSCSGGVCTDSGGGTCRAFDQACTSSSQCCSGNCHPGKKKCR